MIVLGFSSTPHPIGSITINGFWGNLSTIVDVSPLCLPLIFAQIPAFLFPSEKTLLERICCVKWRIDDPIDNEGRESNEYLRGGNWTWSDRNLMHYPLEWSLSASSKLLLSKGLAIQDSPLDVVKQKQIVLKMGSYSAAVFLMAKLLADNRQVFNLVH